MASGTEWRAYLSASDRYDNIQAIKKALEAAEPSSVSTSQKDAFTLENEAYKNSTSRDQYDAACDLAPPPNDLLVCQDGLQAPTDEIPESPGIAIGPYQNCHFVASGVTAEVYRSKGRALKVIVETRNIEPHNPQREAKVLRLQQRPCVELFETFRDQDQRFVLVFPYMPASLENILQHGGMVASQIRLIFTDLFTALSHIHDQGMIHRDIKPSAVLLESPNGPAFLSDFGTAWHPELSAPSEPADNKILDIGTGPYRAPEVLFGNKSYGTPVDMWGAGVLLAECCRQPPRPLFESRPVHEDGNQLGLILSIFKTIGSPTRETWPEAASFKTPPFEMYRAFDGKPWDEILSDVDPEYRKLITNLVRYDAGRVTAQEALLENCIKATSEV